MKALSFALNTSEVQQRLFFKGFPEILGLWSISAKRYDADCLILGGERLSTGCLASVSGLTSAKDTAPPFLCIDSGCSFEQTL